MTYSRLVAILWLAVIMFFTAQPPDRCTTPTDPTCIRAVYQGAPDDYAQVQDIPADLLIQPNTDGHYVVERGQQITVVTAAQLPTGYTRFYLQRTPLERPSPTSYERLIPPVGTTFTFTSSSFEAAAEQLRYDLRAARPPLRPGLKPQLGDIVVTLRFTVTNPPPPTAPAPVDDALSGLPFTPGRYQFSTRPGGNPHLAFSIPTTAHHLEWGGLIINHNGMSLCLSATADDSFLCLGISSATTTSRHEASNARTADGVSIGDVFNYIAASASVDGTTGSQVKSDTLRYRSYDASGAVATPGSYAFLSDPADATSAVSTYEGLRDGATTALLIHKSDTYGASQAALYDAVEADDLFEWRQADDCWVRYAVTEVKPDPGRCRAAQAAGSRVDDLRIHRLQWSGLHERRSQLRLGLAPGRRRNQTDGSNKTRVVSDRPRRMDGNDRTRSPTPMARQLLREPRDYNRPQCCATTTPLVRPSPADRLDARGCLQRRSIERSAIWILRSLEHSGRHRRSSDLWGLHGGTGQAD